MSALPSAGAVAVAHGESAAKRARDEVERPIVMTADRNAFVFRELIAELVENVERAAAMTASIAMCRFAKIVKESRDSDAAGGESPRVCGHIVVNLHRMLRQATMFLVMPVASALEVRRRFQRVYHGIRAGAPEGAKDRDDPVVSVSVIHVSSPIYKKRAILRVFHIKTFAFSIKERLCEPATTVSRYSDLR